MNLLRLMFSFYGRINRAKYWLGGGIILVAAIIFVTAIVTTAYFQASPEGSEEEATLFGQQWAAPIFVFFLIASVSTLSLTVKRLRDLAISVWWVLPIGMIAFGRFYTSEDVRGVLELIQFGVTVWLGIKKGKEDKTSLGSQQEKPDWYYADEGREFIGPISHDELVALLRNVSRPADVRVWQTGFQDWAKVGDLPQLLRAINRPPRLPKTKVAPVLPLGGSAAALPPIDVWSPVATTLSEETSRGSILAKTKALGGTLLGVAVFLAITALPALYILGATWVGEHIIDYVSEAAGLTLLICILILLPLALFRATRLVSVFGLLCSSYVFGLAVWLVGLLDAYGYWGLTGVVIGTFMVGVGIVPVAILGYALQSHWWEIAIMICGLALTYGTRMFSFWLADKVD